MTIYLPIWLVYTLLAFPCAAILLVCVWIIGIFVFPLLEVFRENRAWMRAELEYLFFTWYRQLKKIKRPDGVRYWMRESCRHKWAYRLAEKRFDELKKKNEMEDEE